MNAQEIKAKYEQMAATLPIDGETVSAGELFACRMLAEIAFQLARLNEKNLNPTIYSGIGDAGLP